MATQEHVDELRAKMAEQRAALLAALDGVDEATAEVRRPEADGEAAWSMKEQLSHLAEMEVSYRAWVQRALVEDAPDVTGTVPDPVAHPMDRAHDATVTEHVEELKQQRERTLAVVDGMQLSDFDRTASTRAFGELTSLQWLRSYYRHDRMHVAQIEGRESDYRPRYAEGVGEPDRRDRG